MRKPRAEAIVRAQGIAASKNQTAPAIVISIDISGWCCQRHQSLRKNTAAGSAFTVGVRFGVQGALQLLGTILVRDGYQGTGQFALTMFAALAVPMPDVKSHPTPAL